MKLKHKIKHEWHHLHNRRRLSLYLICLIGVVEYYDFFAFSFIMYYLMRLIGHQLIELYGIALIALLSFVVRPIGYRIHIWLVQRFPRRRVAMINAQCMTLSIIATAFTPIHATKQLWLIFAWLALWRTIHGLSCGIKLQGNLTFIKTSFPRRIHSAVGSSLIGAQLGLSLALLVNKVIFAYFNNDLEWAWRIPFIIGGILCQIVYLFRIVVFAPNFRLEIEGGRQAYFKPIDQVALKSGRNLWLALTLISIRGGLIISIFVILPTIIAWLLGWNFREISNLALAATLSNGLTCYLVRNSQANLEHRGYLLTALWLILPASGFLCLALIHGNYYTIVSAVLLLASLNGYLFVIIPRFIESMFNYQHRLEAMLFVLNFEFFNYNFIRRLILLAAAEILGSLMLTRSIFLGILGASIWIVTLMGIWALSHIEKNHRHQKSFQSISN